MTMSPVSVLWGYGNETVNIPISVPGSHSESGSAFVYLINTSGVAIQARVLGCNSYGLGPCVDCTCNWQVFQPNDEYWLASDYDASITWTLETALV